MSGNAFSDRTAKADRYCKFEVSHLKSRRLNLKIRIRLWRQQEIDFLTVVDLVKATAILQHNFIFRDALRLMIGLLVKVKRTIRGAPTRLVYKLQM